MIDSITIQIPHFVLYTDKHFTKAKYQDLKGKFGVFGRYKTQYTTHAKKCNAEGRYFPQVHILERLSKRNGNFVVTKRELAIQVSLPKLVFGTSIFDVDERLLPVAVARLVEAMREIDVGVSASNILTGSISRVDYSKTIQIAASYGTTDQLLRTLLPYDLKQSSDFNRRDYHNGRDGFYLKFYNSSQAFVIYDKFDEITTNGKTKLEQEIARQYLQGKWKKGALRMEVSIQKKQTVGAVMRRFSNTKKRSFTLEEVARTEYAKAHILKTFEDVYVNDFNRLVRLGELKDKKLQQVINEQTDKLQNRAILYYLAHSVRDRGLKATIDDLRRQTSPATVGRYKRMVEKVLGEADAKHDSVNAISYLHRKLKTFKPVLPKKLDAMLKVADTKTNV